MRDDGLRLAIEKSGGVGALARAIGIAQPSLSNWERVPAERVAAVEAATGVPRDLLRPDLFSDNADGSIDRLRALEYRLIASLFAKAPDAALLKRIAKLSGDASPLGMAHVALAQAAEDADAKKIQP